MQHFDVHDLEMEHLYNDEWELSTLLKSYQIVVNRYTLKMLEELIQEQLDIARYYDRDQAKAELFAKMLELINLLRAGD